MEIIIWILAIYMAVGLSHYFYAVVKGLEITGRWDFSITKDTMAGIFHYPRWMLFWLEWIVRKVKR